MNDIVQTTLNESELKRIASEILEEAKKCGAESAEVGVTANKGFSVRVREGDVETVEYNQDKSIEMTVYFGKKSGSASISDVRPEAIKAAVLAACHIAKFTDSDPDSGLADASELAFHFPRIQTSFPWELSVTDAIQKACECEKLALQFDKRIMSAEEVSVATGQGDYVYANSLGFLGAFPYTHHELSCVLIAKNGDEMERDFSYTVACDPRELKSASWVADDAARRTISRLGARKIKTQKIPVLFLADEARSLFGHFIAAISGGSLYRRASFLLDHLHQKVFPDFMHIAEHPHIDAALGSAPFDNDGVATRNNIFIDQGVLQNYSLGVYSARKLNMKTTGNAGGVHNLTIKTGNKDLQGLLKAMGTGLLVTELIGQGINLVTGDYSRGAGGFWVENGEIQYPVHEITIAGNLRDMFMRMAEVGNDVDMRGNIRTGSVLIGEMMVAGN